MTPISKENATKKKDHVEEGSIESIGIGVKGVATLTKQEFREHMIASRFNASTHFQDYNFFFNRDYHSMLAFVHCTKHRNVAFVRNTNCQDLFKNLPHFSFDDNNMFEILVRSALPWMFTMNMESLNDKTKFDIIKITEIEYLGKIVRRVLIYIPVTTQFQQCCVSSETIFWHPIDEIKFPENPISQTIFGEEARLVASYIKDPSANEIGHISWDPLIETISHDHKWPAGSVEAALLAEVGYNQDKCLIIFEEFYEHLYPSLLMTRLSFSSFLVKYDLIPDVGALTDKRLSETWRYVSCLMRRENTTTPMSFRVFILALALLDKNISLSNPVRRKAIYEFQSRANFTRETSRIDKQNKIILLRLSNPPDTCIVERELPKGAKLTNITEEYHGFFLAPNSFFNFLSHPILKYHSSTRRMHSKLLSLPIAEPTSSTKCFKHQSKPYTYALHTLTMLENGIANNPEPFLGDEMIYPVDARTKAWNDYSMEVPFNSHSHSNILLAALTAMNNEFSVGLIESSTNRVLMDPGLLYHIEELFDEVKTILLEEPPVLRLSGPITIVGSPMGSIYEMLTLQSVYFPPTYVMTERLLFLGNLTSKNFEYPLETLVFLFALKVHAPNHVYILRGVNELAGANVFLREQLNKHYGPERGLKFYATISKIFDSLPYCAVINERVLAAHSGIPNLSKTLYEAVGSSSERNQAFVQLIGNVPSKYAPPKLQYECDRSRGFLQKHENVYYFNREALARFLHLNGFQTFVRSNNSCEKGYSLCYDRTCITISSSSCVHADFKVRNICVLKIDNCQITFHQHASIRSGPESRSPNSPACRATKSGINIRDTRDT